MSGLRDMLMRSKGAVSISHKSVMEHVAEINAAPQPEPLALGRDGSEQAAIDELARIKAGTAHLSTAPAAKPTKQSRPRKAKTIKNGEVVSAPHYEVSALPPVVHKSAPLDDVVFVIDGVGEFDNQVDSVLIEEEVISVWSSGDSEGKGKFRAQRGLELTIRYQDCDFLVWSPGVHIHNPDLGVNVSVYLRK